MAKIYATLIIKGAKHIDEVPEIIRENVKAVLVELGYPELAGYEIVPLPLPIDPEETPDETPEELPGEVEVDPEPEPQPEDPKEKEKEEAVIPEVTE